MAQAYVETGSHGAVIIDDDGTTVFLRIDLNGSPATFANGKPWSAKVNGSNISGSFSISNGQRITVWSGVVASSQTVSFTMGATGTTGLGGPTTATLAVNRALPNAPGTPTVTRVSDSQHSLSWSRNSTYTSCIVQRRENGGSWVQIGAPGGNAFTFTDTTTKANRKYEYRVAGKAASGTSAWSGTATIYTTPAAPTGLSAVRSGSDIVVSASLPGVGTHLEIQDETTTVGTVAKTSLPWTHVAPSPSATHRYRARSRVASGTSAGDLYSGWSGYSNTVQLIAPPNAPVSLAPNGGVRPSDSDVAFTWVHNPVDSSPQSAFEMHYRAPGGAWTTVSGTTAETVSVSLPVGDVEWEVRTKGEHPDWSPWSAIAVFAVIDRPGVAITQPFASWDASVLPVEWTFFQAQSRPQSAWRLQLLDDTLTVVESQEGSGPATTFELATRLTEGTWTVRVSAATGDVWSAWTDEVFTVAFTPPGAPVLSGVWDESQGGVQLVVAAESYGGAVLEGGVWYTEVGV